MKYFAGTGVHMHCFAGECPDQPRGPACLSLLPKVWLKSGTSPPRGEESGILILKMIRENRRARINSSVWAGRAVPVPQLARVQLSTLHAINHSLFSLLKQKTLNPNYPLRCDKNTWEFPKFPWVRINKILRIPSQYLVQDFISVCTLEESGIPSSTLSHSHLLPSSNPP